MAQAQRKFLAGENYYVPAMQAAAELGRGLRGRVQMGAPIAAADSIIMTDHSLDAPVDIVQFHPGFSNSEAQMGRFGRVLTVTPSGAGGTLTVYGRDYLGQKMAESFVMAGAGAMTSSKAFRYVDRVTVPVAAAGVTVDVGVGGHLGLPYTILQVEEEYVDNVAGTVGDIVAPDFTDPQSLTTNDPRGLYAPTAVLNGTKQLELECQFTMFVNAAGNGGLHGMRHFNT